MKAYLQVWTVVLTFLGGHQRGINNLTNLKLMSKALAYKFTELNFNVELNSKGVEQLLGMPLTEYSLVFTSTAWRVLGVACSISRSILPMF